MTYNYNTGGLLSGLTSTKNSDTCTYVSNIGYDKFEQRTYMKYGNGAETNYTYDPLNRRLGNLKVNFGDATLMNNAYTYDKVSNVTDIVNTGTAMSIPNSTKTIGGGMVHHYEYDDLYRLKKAYGDFQKGSTSKTARYDLVMEYDSLHNITSKKQDISQTGVQFAGTLKAGYNLSYSYANNPQQISNIVDSTYRTEGAIVKTAKQQSYGYDANGNLIYVNTGAKAFDGKLQATNSRKLLWDEENRLLALSDNGFVSNYWYDAAGERTVKESGDGQGVSVNGVISGATTGTTNFTAYISPYLVVNNGGNYTKHIYIGSQRITSKVSNSGIFTPSNNPVTTSALQSKYATLTAKIRTRYDSLGVTYRGFAQSGGLVSKTPSPASSPYFYHSDHLGSSSLITDGSGVVTQHLEYVPFGETFIDERCSASSWTTPYLFSAKERDEETGLTYFGARYYDSRTSVWYSVDPLAEKYPGVSSYVYCNDNPVKYVDPDGRNAVSGAIIGAFTEYAGIVGSKMLFDDMSFVDANKSLTLRDAGDITVAAGFGAASGVIDGGIGRLASWLAKPANQKILVKLLEVGVSALESSIKQIYKDEDFDLKSILAGALTEVGMKGLLNSGASEEMAEQATKNAGVEIKKAKDLSKRANPNKRLVNKATNQAKSHTAVARMHQTAQSAKETAAKITANKVQDETQKNNNE